MVHPTRPLAVTHYSVESGLCKRILSGGPLAPAVGLVRGLAGCHVPCEEQDRRLQGRVWYLQRRSSNTPSFS